MSRRSYKRATSRAPASLNVAQHETLVDSTPPVPSLDTSLTDKTLVDRWIHRWKNHKVVASVILACVVVGGVAQLTDAIAGIRSTIFPGEPMAVATNVITDETQRLIDASDIASLGLIKLESLTRRNGLRATVFSLDVTPLLLVDRLSQLPIHELIMDGNTPLVVGVAPSAQARLQSPADLTRLSDLRRLSLSGVGLTHLSGVANFKKLIALDISDNQITDISDLRQLTNLRELSLRDTDAADLDALGQLRELRRLHLGGTPATDLRPLAALTRLEQLYLDTYTDAAWDDLETICRTGRWRDLGASDEEVDRVRWALPSARIVPPNRPNC